MTTPHPHTARHFSRLTAALLGLAFIGLSLTAVSCSDEGSHEVLATVNGKPITRADLVKELRLSRGPSVLLQMIDEQLVVREANAEKLQITPQQIKTRMDQAEANAGSRDDLMIKLKKRGQSLASFQQELTYDLYLQEITRKQAAATDEEIAAYYKQHAKDFRRGERVKARMMLFEDEANAQAISSALAAGGDFAGLAKSFSIDPATSSKGGEMGVIERKDYAKEIVNVAFAQKNGEISKPFKAPDGWCIVQTLERVAGGILPLDDVKGEIQARVLRDKQVTMREKWIEQQRSAAKLSIKDPFLKDEVTKLIQSKAPCSIGQQ